MKDELEDESDKFEDEIESPEKVRGFTPDIVVPGSSKKYPVSQTGLFRSDRLSIPDRSKHLGEGQGNIEQSQMDEL